MNNQNKVAQTGAAYLREVSKLEGAELTVSLLALMQTLARITGQSVQGMLAEMLALNAKTREN